MLLSHTKSTQTDSSALLRLLTHHATPKEIMPQLSSMPTNSKTSQLSQDLVMSLEFTEPTSRSITTEDNTTSTCTSRVHGLSTPPTRPPHMDLHQKDHMLSVERDQLTKDKTPPSKLLSRSGPPPSSPVTTLSQMPKSHHWPRLPRNQRISMLLPRFFKFSSLTNTPTSLSSETQVMRHITLLLSSLNSHTSYKDPLLELDQLLTMKLQAKREFLSFNTTPTS